jgi:hypothetical protein
MRPVADPQTSKRALVVVPDAGLGRNELGQLATVKALMAEMPRARESFDERQHRLGIQRVKYASMLAHEEMAAIVLAAGGSFKMAAAKAGISTRQVKKYYTSADFRARIEELRTTTFSKIRGRVLKELEKRTDPDKIGQIDLLDLLRVHDRVYGAPGGKPGVNIAGDVNVGGTHYDQLIAALFTPQPGAESADFPIFELNGLSTSSDSPPE